MIDSHRSNDVNVKKCHFGATSILLIKMLVLQVKQGKHLITLLSLALLFLYLSITSLLGQGVDKYLNHNLQTMLGADTQLTVTRDWHEREEQWIEQHASAKSYIHSYEITLNHKGFYSHTKLKAVDQSYPINGTITVSDNESLSPLQVSAGPNVGEVWLEPHLARALNVKVGGQVFLGNKSLLVSALLLNEPDRIIQGYSSDRRAIIAKTSLENLLLTPIENQVLLNHSDALGPQLRELQANSADLKVVSKILNNYPMAHAWQRVQNFMGLISFVIVLLTCLCLWLSQRSHVEPLQNVLAVMLANGVKREQVPLLVLVLMASILFISFAPSLAIAIGISMILEYFIQQKFFVTFELMWDMAGIGQALFMSMFLYCLLTAPSWAKLVRSNVRDLLEKREDSTVAFIISGLCPLLSLLAVVIFNTDNWVLTGLLLSGLGVCLVLLLVLAWGGLNIANKILSKKSGILAFVLLLMKQRMHVKIVQILALGLSATLLLLCLRVGQDVSDVLDRALFADQGNIFVTQADQEQKQALTEFTLRYGGDVHQFKAFQSARVTHVNGVLLSEIDAPSSDSKSRLERNINLHWQEKQPDNIKVVEGHWQQKKDSGLPLISMEQEVFNELNLELGDVLTMQVGGTSQQFSIATVHHYRSGSDMITFWFVVHQPDIPVPNEPIYFMGSVDLPELGLAHLGEIWQAYPGIRMLRVEELISRVRSSVQTFIYLTLVYGIFIALMSNLLVIASIQTHLQRDKLKNGLLLSFGLSDKQSRKMLIIEWTILTMIPVACALTSIYLFIGQIYQQGFGMSYKPNDLMLVTEAVVIVMVIALGGIFLSRKQLKQSVVTLLEQRG
ncbi:ABC transporter permease [Pseudoalteromonas luteoviolacea]|uniref:ABC3 transporter permease C-terminal domain-containing protein n=1 Tax=Pseudoalteromonas luteoviolacea S4054 TaxID=1129367 RepID=A0A0F6AGM9_9GAMM|nr:FtsX-like permease family protein [Pseudoalteromonas luteoviolacea]AOT11207.1 hypothetical protein S4054249_25620 [Pseudoalteromonas luteoviolacea]AOT15629.1 hypothetical protein S40542_22890 [Pseudoalteromonas luteoviolacea]AOT21028.1 hypothetical protein S4054_25540 [Pseudoalteromonas luteoviolacea]KKE84559.1 hypothetical protein N479_08315 [Pseudoalteromonas luteoviolacea S4054]KZN71296.1 hypothetical protein N481_19105 [Pseudoalteromonas luteoviolacea S4047-1]